MTNLRREQLIAEAWDTGDAYQVRSLSTQHWTEWNGRFRDDVRRFWIGDAPATVEQKAALEKLSPADIHATEVGGEQIGADSDHRSDRRGSPDDCFGGAGLQHPGRLSRQAMTRVDYA